jgi:hypothetical protein
VADQAVALIPMSSPYESMCLSNLSAILHSRFKKTGSLDDLLQSITIMEKAISVTPEDDPSKATDLCTLGVYLCRLFEVTGSIVDLNRAISVLEQSKQLTPEHRPSRAARLTSLGSLFETRFARMGLTDDIDRAITAYEEGFAVVTAPPGVRIVSAMFASRLLVTRDPNLAKPFLQAAIELIPVINPRSLKQSDKQRNISVFAGVTSAAVSVFLECGESPYNALQLLELGRGPIASFQLELRSDVSKLESLNPGIAQQFKEIRDQLDRPASEDAEISQRDLDREDERQRETSKNFDSLLDNIRLLEGLERFLLGPSEQEIKDLAEHGWIVIFNVSEYRSDAILVDKDRIRAVRLPSLDHRGLDAYASTRIGIPIRAGSARMNSDRSG